MEINIKTTVLILGVITTALSAGIFYAWTFTVIPGTKKIADSVYLETMQSINREILNPGFFSIFFGAAILLIICSILQYQVKVGPGFILAICAFLTYLIGTIGVTMWGNVPLNNIVEAMELSTFSADDFSSARLLFEEKWNQLNTVRTVASITSFVLILLSLIKH